MLLRRENMALFRFVSASAIFLRPDAQRFMLISPDENASRRRQTVGRSRKSLPSCKVAIVSRVHRESRVNSNKTFFLRRSKLSNDGGESEAAVCCVRSCQNFSACGGEGDALQACTVPVCDKVEHRSVKLMNA
jgi:hypothetical protein